MERQELAGGDPIDLQLLRGAAGSSRMPKTEQTKPQSAAPVTRQIDTNILLQVTPHHGDKASFLGWKRFFLIAVRAIRTQENSRQHESRFLKIPIVQ